MPKHSELLNAAQNENNLSVLRKLDVFFTARKAVDVHGEMVAQPLGLS